MNVNSSHTGGIVGLWTKFKDNPILGGERLGTCFDVDPLCDPSWDWFTLSCLDYRGHDVGVSWRRSRTGLTVTLDGREAAHSPDLARLYIPLDPP